MVNELTQLERSPISVTSIKIHTLLRNQLVLEGKTIQDWVYDMEKLYLSWANPDSKIPILKSQICVIESQIEKIKSDELSKLLHEVEALTAKKMRSEIHDFTEMRQCSGCGIRVKRGLCVDGKYYHADCFDKNNSKVEKYNIY